MNEPLYAHTPEQAGEAWHLLVQHSEDVAAALEVFLDPLHLKGFARPLGVLHDAGKALPAFQRYLVDAHAGRVKPPGPPHASYGARVAWAAGYPELLNVLRGHHAGLMDRAPLRDFILERVDEVGPQIVEDFIRGHFSDVLDRPARPVGPVDALEVEFRTRMLLSALADADYLDTERYRQPERANNRASLPLHSYIQAFESRMAELGLIPSSRPIDLIRQEIFSESVAAALGPPGVYQLTTPTGGGKTRAGLAFALKHAERHGLRRIIMAAPFNSITTQTAHSYRDLLRGLPVLEHHAAAAERLSYPFRLAAENWDSTVIVTSFVQLLESLHGAHPGQVRKLHRLAGSVVILDEVQAVPVSFTAPVVRMLEQLTEMTNTTVLLCTATPPAVHGQTPFLRGFRTIRQVIEPQRQQLHFQALKRVKFTQAAQPLSWLDLAGVLKGQRQTLTILNTRRDALALLDAIRAESDLPVYHLSTLQCGAHRSDVLDAVTVALKDGLNVHLVSTQVVEAGVDIDFPFVARAVAPLPSIIQAAGRCNRNSRLKRGTTLIFEPSEGTPLPQGEYRDLVGITRAMLATPGALVELDEPGVSEAFYTRAYAQLNTDARNILEQRTLQNFQTVEERFRLIDDEGVAIYVLYGDAQDKLSSLSPIPTRTELRRLAPFSVSVSESFIQRHLKTHLNEIRPGIRVWTGEYDKVAGLRAALTLR